MFLNVYLFFEFFSNYIYTECIKRQNFLFCFHFDDQLKIHSEEDWNKIAVKVYSNYIPHVFIYKYNDYWDEYECNLCGAPIRKDKHDESFMRHLRKTHHIILRDQINQFKSAKSQQQIDAACNIKDYQKAGSGSTADLMNECTTQIDGDSHCIFCKQPTESRGLMNHLKFTHGCALCDLKKSIINVGQKVNRQEDQFECNDK